MLCAICGCVGKEYSATIQLFDKNNNPLSEIGDTIISVPAFFTRVKGFDICEICMEKYRKIFALFYKE